MMNEREKEEFLKHLREQAESLNKELGNGNLFGGFLNLGNTTNSGLGDLGSLGSMFFGNAGNAGNLDDLLKQFINVVGTPGCADGKCEKDCAEGECKESPLSSLFGGKGLESLADLFGGLRPEGPEGSGSVGKSIFGAVNVFEDTKTYIVTVALPGVSKSEINVSGVEEDLIIEVKLNSVEADTATYKTREYVACDLTRAVRLSNMDSTGVKVKFTNGELTIVVPKIDVQAVHFEVK